MCALRGKGRNRDTPTELYMIFGFSSDCFHRRLGACILYVIWMYAHVRVSEYVRLFVLGMYIHTYPTKHMHTHNRTCSFGDSPAMVQVYKRMAFNTSTQAAHFIPKSLTGYMHSIVYEYWIHRKSIEYI